MKLIASLLASFCMISALSACGDDSPPPPADVHGVYSISETNGPSSCQIPNWNQGASTTGIPFTVTQNGGSVSADVGGVGQIFLMGCCGNAHFAGSVSGNTLDLRLAGTTSLSAGSCAYTIDAHLVATVQNDALTGTVTYTPNTNSSPDCASVQTCSARMNVNGTRPPSGQ